MGFSHSNPTLNSNSVSSGEIVDGTIVAVDLASGAVTEAKIGTGAVTTNKIGDLAVTTGKLAADAVNGTKIADDAIDSEHIAAGAIDAEHFAAGAVDATAIGAGAVGTSELAADAVDGTKIADDAVNSEHIAAGAIDAEHFAAGAVDSTAIGANAVGSSQLSDNAVDTAAIADEAVTAAKLAPGAVETAATADGSITAPKIAAAQEFTASGTIDDAAGQLVTFSGSSGQTLTLPEATVGRQFEVWNIDTSDAVTVARDGTDTIVDHLTAGATTFRVPAGARAAFVCVSAGVWQANYLTRVTKVGSFTPSAGTGNKAVTGVGFRPKSVRFFHLTGANASVARTMSGAMDAAGNQSVAATLSSGADTNMASSTAACIGLVDTSGAFSGELASFVSMDADGFTVNYSVNSQATMGFEAIA